MSSDSSRIRARSIDVAMTGVPASSACFASCAAASTGTRSLTLRDSFSSRVDRLVDGLEVGEDQLGLDRGDVAARVDLAVDVGDVLVAEDARDLADRGRFADVREELVAQALALRRAADDAGDVDELHRGRQQLLRAVDLRELREPVVRYADDADVGLDRRERVVRREHVVLGQRVEERRLACVGETDDADGECHGRSLYEGVRPARESRRPRNGVAVGAGGQSEPMAMTVNEHDLRLRGRSPARASSGRRSPVGSCSTTTTRR